MEKINSVIIRRVRKTDVPQWLSMRRALWPDCPLCDHRKEIAEILEDGRNQPVWVAESDGGELAGFLEISVRNHLEGVGRVPGGYLEGWYVKPTYRKRGIGQALVASAEQWAVRRGFTHMASDTELDNTTSLKTHQAMGYRETDRCIHYVKRLNRKGRS